MNGPIRVAAVLAVACATASCGGDDDAGGSDFETTLGRIPASALEGDGDSSPEVYYSDMAIRWRQLDLADADAEARLERSPELVVEAETFTIGPLMIERSLQAQLEETRTEVGFTAFDIEREATVLQLPQSLSVAGLRVDADTIDDAVRSDPTWSDDLEEVEYDGGAYYSWGEDGARTDFERRGPFHGMLGRGGQLAIEGDGEPVTAVRALSIDEMEAALDADAGDEPSALDGGPLVPLVDAVGDGEVIQAFAVFEPLVFDTSRMTRTQIEEMMDEMIVVGRYRSIMLVEILEDDEPRTEILLDFGDEDEAEDNIAAVEEFLSNGISARTRQPWSELLPNSTTEQRGEVIVVTVSGEGHFKAPFEGMLSRDLFVTRS